MQHATCPLQQTSFACPLDEDATHTDGTVHKAVRNPPRTLKLLCDVECDMCDTTCSQRTADCNRAVLSCQIGGFALGVTCMCSFSIAERKGFISISHIFARRLFAVLNVS